VNETPFAITLPVGSSLANKTGSWRVERPRYVALTPPCSHACPAGEQCQAWLFHAEEGDYESAWREIMEVNPLPAIMGRACFHPCETSCNRTQLDESVGINAVERFLGDHALDMGWRVSVDAPSSGRRVLVVGAGPAGLSAAYHLVRQGHRVVVADGAERPGGMLRYGIPAYRLPRDVVDAEIARIAEMGVEFRCSHPVTSLQDELADGGFDAAFVAVGQQRGRNPGIPAGDAARVLDAVSMLHGLESGDELVLGRRVVVYGGGDTAMDAARTAQRLGAAETIVVYRRTRDKMPAHDEEVSDALDEGVQLRWLSTVAHADGGRMVLERMELSTDGRAVGTGVTDELEADALVLALGQEADLRLLDGLDDVELAEGQIGVDEHLATGRSGVYAGGDAIDDPTGGKTITAAVGHGRRAAAAIGRFLVGEAQPVAPIPRLATYDRLHTWYFDDAPRTYRPRLEAARRRTTFEEVVGGLTVDDALFEARRCMSCGNCFECDNCYGVCPDNAVIKLSDGQKYEFNLDYCKGCGICVAECPCGAIDLVPEHLAD